MWKFPDGHREAHPPKQIVVDKTVHNFSHYLRSHGRAAVDALGYNECVPLRREPYTTYETQWERGEDLIYRETVVSADVDEAARLEDARARKAREIVEGSDAIMSELTSTYSEHEKLTWPKQEAEAKALQADSSAPAPLLSGLAAARGLDMLTMRDKVLANVAQYETLSASIVGQQQVYEDQLKAAVTYEEVEAIKPEYSIE